MPSVHRQKTADIAPDQVRLTVVTALGQLRGLASMDIAVPTAGAVSDTADTTGRVHTIGAEVEAIVHEVAHSQTTLDRELRRLERAFDTVHHSAATHVIRTRIPAGAVRVAALIGLNLNVSTLSRARRTPARAVFVQEAWTTPDDTTLRTITALRSPCAPQPEEGSTMTRSLSRRATLVSDIPARIDRLPWSPFHVRAVTALGTCWILDGFEITIASNIGEQLS
jgi:hypothetical protein